MASSKISLALVLLAMCADVFVATEAFGASPGQLVPRTPANPLAPETLTMQQLERRLRELLVLAEEKVQQLQYSAHTTGGLHGALGALGPYAAMGMGGLGHVGAMGMGGLGHMGALGGLGHVGAMGGLGHMGALGGLGHVGALGGLGHVDAVAHVTPYGHMGPLGMGGLGLGMAGLGGLAPVGAVATPLVG